VGCATVGSKRYLQTNTPREQRLLSIEDEYKFGHYIDALIQNKYMVLDNFEYKNQIETIFYKIVNSSDRKDLKFTLRILNSNDVNAFAGPGGYVYITTGLLNIIESKDELAGVLAHEVGHICARHSIKRFYAIEGAKTIITLATLGIAATTENPDATRAMADLSSLIAVISIQGYSRQDELQADSLATKYSLRSGYNPLRMIDLLKRMQKKKEEETGEKTVYTWLSSHPSLDIREENLVEQLNLLKRKE